MSQVAYIIVDWGTTNFRAFALDSQHQLVDSKEASLGLLQVVDGQFAQTLEKVLKDWLGQQYASLPVYMAGMVGSAKGWVNVPYASTRAGKQQLIQNAHSFALPWGPKATILPGVSHQHNDDQYDVMRGEEIQLIGLASISNEEQLTAVLPGTHSKHANVQAGEITQFSSFLSGEIYSVFSQHLLLGKDLPHKPEFDQEAFLKGVAESQEGELSNRVFLAWTHRLFGNLAVEQIPDYLSGLLIGFELRSLVAQKVFVIGGEELTKRYTLAMQFFGIHSESCSGNECFLTGMIELIKEANL